MAAWIAANQRSKARPFTTTEQDTLSIVSPKPVHNLMQNCDLPPPLKLFSGPNETYLFSISKIDGTSGGQEAMEYEHQHMCGDCSGIDNLELLKASRLSQTRAREAERKLRVLSKDMSMLSNLLVKESSQLFALRQWICLLELQILKLQRQQLQEEDDRQKDYAASSWKEDFSSNKWCVAIALSLAIAGVGFAFGCRYLL